MKNFHFLVYCVFLILLFRGTNCGSIGAYFQKADVNCEGDFYLLDYSVPGICTVQGDELTRSMISTQISEDVVNFKVFAKSTDCTGAYFVNYNVTYDICTMCSEKIPWYFSEIDESGAEFLYKMVAEEGDRTRFVYENGDCSGCIAYISLYRDYKDCEPVDCDNGEVVKCGKF